VRIPDAVQRWYDTARYCAGCQQAIAKSVRHVVIGIQTFHPSCSKRRAQESTVTTKPAQVLCTLDGIAVPHDEPCVIVDDNGATEHEEFRSGCYDRDKSTE
jgi:hypothetical protein